MERTRIAFIGLGAMGMPMARNLAKATAYNLVLYDVSDSARSRAREFGIVVDDIRSAVDGADVVLTMLPNDRIVADVFSEVSEYAKTGSIFLDLSTILPSTIREMSTTAGTRLVVLDGGCMKSVAAAEAGDLTIFVSGPVEERSGILEILGRMASTVLITGPLGSSKSLKIVNNFVTASLNFAIAECAIIASYWKISFDSFAQACQSWGIGGWPLINQFIKFSIPNNLGPGRFSVRYMKKDVTLARQLFEEHGVSNPITPILETCYRGAEAMGFSESYHPVIIRWLDHIEGTQPAQTRPQDSQTVLNLLCAWLCTFERIISISAIDLAYRNGVDPNDAISYLADASASCRALQELGTYGLNAWWQSKKTGPLMSIDDVLDLCNNNYRVGLGPSFVRNFVTNELDGVLENLKVGLDGER